VADHGEPSSVNLHRFFLPPAALDGDEVAFPEETERQIRKVLRLGEGDRIVVLDGSGMEYVVRLRDEHRGTVEERRHNEAEPATVLTLYQGLLKGAKLELVIQKGVEIGMSRMVPVATARSVPAEPGPSRRRRFETIAREAAEQCRRGRVPEVADAIPLAAALERAASEDVAVLLWEGERAVRLRNLIPAAPVAHAALFVGPEGGFTAEEVEAARAAGVHVATLGRRTLRAETAALVGTALLLEYLGEA
jgi:16S rRNA (uracil1498-N3)-methyltransferase